MKTAEPASLIDDLDFLAALEKLEATPKPGMIEASPDELQKFARERSVRTRVESNAVPQFVMPQAAAAPAIEDAERSATHPFLGALFVLMMSIGAGAAALVFHDRVALIVAQWQSASR